MNTNTKIVFVFLLTACLCTAASAAVGDKIVNTAAGPIRPELQSDRIVDGFESDKAGYFIRTYVQGKPTKPDYTLTRINGFSKEGNCSLRLDLRPPDPFVNCALQLGWKLDPPLHVDGGFEDFGFFIQGVEGVVPEPVLVVTTVDGEICTRSVDSSEKGMVINPRLTGAWQQVRLSLLNEKWWQATPGKKEAKKRWTSLNGKEISAVQLGFPAKIRENSTCYLDDIGFFRQEPSYNGPVVEMAFLNPLMKGVARRWILSGKNPQEDYRIKLTVGGLGAETKSAVLRVSAVDYLGTKTFEQSYDLTPNLRSPHVDIMQDISVPGGGPGHLRVTAILSVNGKDIYKAVQDMATVLPLDPSESERKPESVFGIWAGGWHEQLGATWTRDKGPSVNDFIKDGKIVVKDGKPGPVFKRTPESPYSVCCLMGTIPDWFGSWKENPDFWETCRKYFEAQVEYLKQSGNVGYEVFNEPNAKLFGGFDIVKLHEVAYKAVKKIDPSKEVLGPCPYNISLTYIEDFLAKGGGKWIDHLVTHAYADNPEVFRQQLHDLHSLMRKYDLGDRKIYITEMGYSTPWSTEREQARNCAKSYAYGIAEGVNVIVWHQFGGYSGRPEQDPGFAIVNSDHSPRPYYVAYAAASRMLDRTKYIGELKMPTENQHGFEFGKNGKTILVLWDVKGRSAYALPISTPAKPSFFRGIVEWFSPPPPPTPLKEPYIFDLMGKGKKLTPEADGKYQIELMEDPIYVIY
ncbi:MAG: hypothetical protein WAX69_03590 [Victivallales bacterium]